MPDVTFPDVESIVVSFLRAQTGLSVHTRWPQDRSRTTRAWRTGGPAINRVLERAQITITCQASKDAVQAQADAQACRHAFHNNYTAMSLVRGVSEVSGVYYDPDPDDGSERYTFTVELLVRGGI